MRIDRLRIEHFGALQHYDTGPEPVGSLVVIFGPNESGKTTFFNFTRDMIYGFSPAARRTHPYAPWSGADIDGQMDGHLDSGDPFAVRRRLRSGPWGRLQLAGEEVELRNRSVPFAEHVPAAVFQKLFALTLDELAALDPDTWGALQDRLLAAMVMDDLNPAKDVAHALRTEGRSLWRPDRRARPRAREITAQIKELQALRRTSTDRDAQVRRHQQDLVAARDEHERLQRRRAEVAAALRELERLVPALQRLARLGEARDQSTKSAGVHDIPSHPEDVVARLEEDVIRYDRDAQRLAERQEALETEVSRFTEADRRIVGLREQLRAVEDTFGALPGLEARAVSEREAHQAAVERLEATLDTLLTSGAGADAHGEDLSSLSFESIDRVVARAVSAHQDADGFPALESSANPLIPASAAIVGGVTLIIASGTTGSTVAAAFGGALLVFAMLAFGVAWDRRRRDEAARVRHTQAVADAGRRREGAIAELRELVGTLPVRAELLADPQPTLTARLRSAASQIAEVERLTASQRNRSEQLDAARSVTSPLLEALGRGSSTTSNDVFRALDAAEQRAEAARVATGQLEGLRTELREMEAERTGANRTLARLRARLIDIGDGSLDDGLERVEEWRTAERRAEDLERDLRRDFGDPEEVEAQAAAFRNEHPQWTLEAASIREARTEVDDITRRSEALAGRLQGLEGEVRHLQRGETPTEIESRIAALTDERARLRRERDRLELLARIVEEAESRFREHHQPDVLKKSAAYLARITEGRYTRFLPAHEGRAGVLTLETGDGRPVGIDEALSRGTKEQVLLSLRLAAADHMDENGEKLPLFVDEVFVNWDRGRRDRGLELLRQLSGSRQVFVFTCHGDVAERLASLGGTVLPLVSS